ncbi:pentatricopeptide repeat-containing protein At3g49170, chloroplastic isoform X2 [Lactuca sativa]|uniref:pentatricopeptide repeat-containing protein At3g49170, chloroplastic isoform X2 n=1 Tax=Lactuca sativa TaxID=4236 RepID=UPI001C68BC8F|nr:pentatricopeptide repeat-containing protein At3g49170, chloroplastic isoform X2 [Lactuca sativa]
MSRNWSTSSMNVHEKNPSKKQKQFMGSTENGLFHDAFRYFIEMQTYGIFPDAFTYSAFIQLCLGLDYLNLGKMIHAQIIKTRYTLNVRVATSLLNMYAKMRKVNDSWKVFSSMEEHNEVSWNALISGFTENGLFAKAFDSFLEMIEKGFTPNKFTFVSVLKAIGKLHDVNKGKHVHKCIVESDMESDVFVGTSLIDMYSKCGDISDARFVFETNFITCSLNMPWNAMLSGYIQCNCIQEALELYIRMCESNIKSDVYTYCSVFTAIATMKSLRLVRQVHGIVKKSGYESYDNDNDTVSLSVRNAIGDAYAKCGSLEDVKTVFDKVKERDVVSWTILMSCYSRCLQWEEALVIFSEMRKDGFTPNQFTFSNALVACASLCFLEYGRQLHGLIWKTGWNTDKCIESGLIDMYAKCGSLNDAKIVFESVNNHDVVTWTSIISSYAQHGDVVNALEMFKKMKDHGFEPNSITMLCVLFACSHGGRVEEGLYYFKTMKEIYNLVPQMEHYSCVVDMLGRVGRINDAYEFIKKMDVEPNVMVWENLLGACRVYGNIELGEIAAKKIISINPHDSSPYVLLSNAYVQRGSFMEGIGVRNVMKERGVKKEAGCSWICVRGRVHKFYAKDEEHEEKNELYFVLDVLKEKLRDMGYIPDLRYVLESDS